MPNSFRATRRTRRPMFPFLGCAICQLNDRPSLYSTKKLLLYTQSVPPTQTEQKGGGTGLANTLFYHPAVCLALNWGQMLLLRM